MELPPPTPTTPGTQPELWWCRLGSTGESDPSSSLRLLLVPLQAAASSATRFGCGIWKQRGKNSNPATTPLKCCRS